MDAQTVSLECWHSFASSSSSIRACLQASSAMAASYSSSAYTRLLELALNGDTGCIQAAYEPTDVVEGELIGLLDPDGGAFERPRMPRQQSAQAAPSARRAACSSSVGGIGGEG